MQDSAAADVTRRREREPLPGDALPAEIWPETADPGGAEAPVPAAGAAVPPAPSRRAGRHIRRAGRAGITLILVMVVLALASVLAVLALTGKPIRLPVWAVAEIESRGTELLARDMPGSALAIGGVELALDRDWTPRLRLEDLRLLHARGTTLLALPDLRLDFDAGALISERALRPHSLRITGANLALRRNADGTLDLQLGSAAEAPQVAGLAGLLDAIDLALERPLLSRLALVEVEAASLSLSDAMTGRQWTVGDGRLRLDVRPETLAAELAVSLVGGGEAPARAVVTALRPRGETRLRLTATVDQVAARDIAAQAPILSWLGVLAAPISGRISAEITEAGLAAMEAEMTLGAGALQPEATARPIPFDRAGLRLGYDPARGRIEVRALSVESPSLRLRAGGHAYPLDRAGQILTGPLGRQPPAGFLGQVSIEEAQIDPEGLFERPLLFKGGAMDLRLTLAPFRVEIGQVALVEERDRRLSLSGQAAITPQGWSVALDLGLDAIAHDRLLQLWPKTLVPNTRAWVGQNVANGLLTNVNAALRIAPGGEPRLALGYEFDGAEVRFLRTLPPVRQGRGRSSIEGKRYMIVLEEGEVEAPLGGRIDVAGSVFTVPDVTQKPARAEISLKTRSTITAALSLLDLPPFGFMTKAGRPADLGEGLAEVSTRLSLPLQRRVQLQDVDYQVSGVLRDVTSDQLIRGKTVTAKSLRLNADPSGLVIAGPGQVGAARFDVAFRQGFGPEAKGRAQVEGTVDLTPEALEVFNIGLPRGMVSGQGKGKIALELRREGPGRLVLTSDLQGLGLRVDALAWSKPAARAGKLTVEAQLGTPPRVTRLDLSAPGLAATGEVVLKPAGGLDQARFDKVTVGDWMRGAVTLTGRGTGRAPDVAVTGGEVDMRRLPKLGEGGSGAGQGGGGLALRLDRLIVTDSIALTGFEGRFASKGGFNGSFRGMINGAAPVTGEAAPSRHGTAIRLTSPDAGAALKAAGIFTTAKGGTLAARLTPRSAAGTYDAHAEIRDIRVRKTSALAELLSAVSVVGLLEQLNGTGILFSSAEFDLVLTPQAVQISEGSAVGASLGVTVAGLYGTKTRRLALQGVVSPIYLVNGIGAALTRRGEGLFGFNYALSGTSDAPEVQVNPLSILTPGMFREIFRSPPPVLGTQEQ